MPTKPTGTIQPLLVSTSDILGGAARAAYRLHKGLRSIGIDSEMLSFNTASRDPSVHKLSHRLAVQQTKLSTWLDKQPLQLYPDRQQDSYWSLNWFYNSLSKQINGFVKNIVHLHWIGNGFVPIPSLKHVHYPLVWTLHDMWTFTGGCHYTNGCLRYRDQCGKCPQLGSDNQHDLSWFTLQRKKFNWKDINLTVVTPSRWLADHACSSMLLRDTRIEVIPNGLDLQEYKMFDKSFARQVFNLPLDKKLILAGAHEGLRDKRKGVQYLQPALQKLDDDEVELVVIGTANPNNALDFGRKTHYIGYLHDDKSLALAYSAADIFVAPSLQDNLPNTIMESMACGTPVVAFNIGGIPEMIEHQQTGYLAQAFDVNDLLYGMQWTLEQASNLKHPARDYVEAHYELTAISQRYRDLYMEVLNA